MPPSARFTARLGMQCYRARTTLQLLPANLYLSVQVPHDTERGCEPWTRRVSGRKEALRALLTMGWGGLLIFVTIVRVNTVSKSKAQIWKRSHQLITFARGEHSNVGRGTWRSFRKTR